MTDATNDEPFALGGVVAMLRRPVDLGPSVDDAVMASLRLAPAPLTVIAGDAAPRAMRRTAEAPSRGRRAWGWLTRPRSLTVTPVGALAAAGLFIAAVFGLRRDAARNGAERSLRATGEFPTATGEFAAIRPTGEHPAVIAASNGGARQAVGGTTTSVTNHGARDTVTVTRFMLVAPGAREVSLVGDFNDWDHAATPLVHVANNGVWTVELPLAAGRYSYAFLVDGQRWLADPAAPRAVGDDFGRPSSVVTVRGGGAA